jgi:hypothetical protein
MRSILIHIHKMHTIVQPNPNTIDTQPNYAPNKRSQSTIEDPLQHAIPLITPKANELWFKWYAYICAIISRWADRGLALGLLGHITTSIMYLALQLPKSNKRVNYGFALYMCRTFTTRTTCVGEPLHISQLIHNPLQQNPNHPINTQVSPHLNATTRTHAYNP